MPTFRVGDGLELMVEEDTSFNGQFSVRPEGYVLIPKLGRIPVLGLTRDGAERKMRESLQRSQLTKATVFVELISSGPDAQAAMAQQPRIKVFLTGKVGSPGQHQIPVVSGRNPGVYEALLMAGGPSNFGNLSKVEIMRQDSAGLRRKQVVDVRAIEQGKTSDVPLGDGDIINVPPKVFGF
ncbi:polysaccharide biosynthesis/export family protein [Phragmitibacter flavus]|nr:polysaccharide biosynthesis/export family protein [Phragmitibacter flavus]